DERSDACQHERHTAPIALDRKSRQDPPALPNNEPADDRNDKHVAVVRIAPEIVQPNRNHGRIEPDQNGDDRPREHARQEPRMALFAKLTTSVARQTDRLCGHRASPADRKDKPSGCGVSWLGPGRVFVRSRILTAMGLVSSEVVIPEKSKPLKVNTE